MVTLYCETYKSTLVQQRVSGDMNPPGLGHVSAWVCLSSGTHIWRRRVCERKKDYAQEGSCPTNNTSSSRRHPTQKAGRTGGSNH